MEKTCSVVLLRSWYAAWSKGILVFNLSQVRLMRHIVSNFLNTDKSIIGRKFSGGPFFFPGFGSGVRIPILSSSGGFPSFAVVFSIYVLYSREQTGAHILYVPHVCRQSHYFFHSSYFWQPRIFHLQ